MHLIHVDTVKEQDELRGTRTWLVIADSLFEAMSLVPVATRRKRRRCRQAPFPGPDE